MRIAYFNCFAGISGDMTIGALLDAGLDFDHLCEELERLHVDGYHLVRESVKRHHIAATSFDVHLHTHDHEEHHEHNHHTHGHDHGHEHEHEHHEHHAREDVHVHQHEHRGLKDVVEIIERAKLSPGVTERAIAIFTRLAEAEAKMHDSMPDEVHFHEVGAVDAIVDIVGACIGLEALGIDRIYSSPVRVGTGEVKVAHGVMPVPAPGTLELLRGFPVEHTDYPFEMTTPTGAAIITTIADEFAVPPMFTPEQVGYGAGGRDPKQIANLLRVEIGESQPPSGDAALTDRIVHLETNIDDMTPEVYGYIIDRLFAAGAKDVYLAPVMMKKNRPGVVVHVLADESDRDTLVDVLFTETPTLGVRMSEVVRRILPRESGEVATRWGTVRTKRGEYNGKARVTPEYDDCATIARKHSVPILDVYEAVRQALSESNTGGD